MPDDAQLARLEERMEAFRKYIGERLEDHEDEDARRFAEIAETIRAEFAAFEKLMRSGIDAALVANDAKTAVLQLKLEAQVAAAEAKVAVATQEARLADLEHDKRLAVAEATNRPYRVALGLIAGAFVTALVALLFSVLTAKEPAKLTPQLPPAHSTREQKER